jgi:flagellar hook-associated protein 1 FlgK
MGNLLASLLNSANALDVYNQGLTTTENNILNANTPGYANQTQTLLALPFDPSVGLPGGVGAGPVQSSRNAAAERAVQQQQSGLGASQQQASDLNNIQNLFSLTSNTSVNSSLNTLFQSFSALSVNPNDPATRQTVLNDAQQVAQAFNDVGNGLQSAIGQIGEEATSTVTSINQLTAQIAHLNQQRMSNNNGVDAGADATMYADLEQLSQYANFTALQQPDGSISVYLGGQTPVVIGDQSYGIQANTSLPQLQILSAQGNDITSQITGGQLAGEITVRNSQIPSYLSGINSLAQSVADQVNTTLAQGLDQNGNSPVNNLFTYDATTGAAQSLAVNPLVTTDQIAAALPGAPGGNGNALNLAALANAANTNGQTFTQAYAALTAQVGGDISTANTNVTTDQQLLTQAQTARSNISGVSLNEQAAALIQFQRSYQAAAKMITVLDDMTNTVLSILP